MTPDQLKSTLTAIVTEVDGVADFGGVIDPALLPIIAIGKAVAGQVPGLAATVDGWLKGNAPSADDIAAKAAELAVLGNPGGPS